MIEYVIIKDSLSADPYLWLYNIAEYCSTLLTGEDKKKAMAQFPSEKEFYKVVRDHHKAITPCNEEDPEERPGLCVLAQNTEHNEIIGFFRCHSPKQYDKSNTWMADLIAVDPEYSRQGIGTQLIQKMEATILEKTGNAIIGVAEPQDDGTALFKHCGFKNSSKRMGALYKSLSCHSLGETHSLFKTSSPDEGKTDLPQGPTIQ